MVDKKLNATITLKIDHLTPPVDATDSLTRIDEQKKMDIVAHNMEIQMQNQFKEAQKRVQSKLRDKTQADRN